MATVEIRNLKRRMLTFELPPEVGGVDRQRVASFVADGSTRGLAWANKRVPRTLTLMAAGTPGDALQGQPEALRRVPELVAAEQRGEIRIVDEKDRGAEPSTTNGGAGGAAQEQ